MIEHTLLKVTNYGPVTRISTLIAGVLQCIHNVLGTNALNNLIRPVTRLFGNADQVLYRMRTVETMFFFSLQEIPAKLPIPHNFIIIRRKRAVF
jgi:hypothetical protein